jgi:glucokinase
MPLGTEGGHASFSPCDESEIEILRFARRRYPHVSFERLLSGPGIVLIHAALRNRAGSDVPQESASEIGRRAIERSDALCVDAMDCFCAILGTAAGNLALTIGATGGVFIGGGIVPRLGMLFDRSPFRTRFEDKGRFAPFLREIPTYVITSDDTTLLGASVIFDETAAR